MDLQSTVTVHVAEGARLDAVALPAPRTPAPRRIEWAPELDITPHELAVAMPAVVRLTHGGLFVERIVAGLIEAMPGSVQRHFRVEAAGAGR